MNNKINNSNNTLKNSNNGLKNNSNNVFSTNSIKNSYNNVINSETFKKGQDIYNNSEKIFNETDIKLKILNIVLFGLLVIIFTTYTFNIGLSLLFMLILFLMLFMINKLYAILFFIFYIILLIRKIQNIKKYLGNPVSETDINGKGPYDCTSGALTVSSSSLPEETVNGIYTYSFWLFVNGNSNDLNDGVDWYSYKFKEWKSIFYRGTPINKKSDLSSLIQYPGFWLTPVLNNLVIVFQIDDNVERIEVDNIELNKWINIVLVTESQSLKIYIDGYLSRSVNMKQSVRNMCDYNIYVTNDEKVNKSKKTGFSGYLAQLICYNYALNPNDIMNAYNYYNKIFRRYQTKQNYKNSYAISNLITNSDYEKCTS